MLRNILCNYEFLYRGVVYKCQGLYLGDTNVPRVALQRDYSLQVVSLALKITEEDLARALNSKYWDISRKKLAEAGFLFKQLDVYFYPSTDKD